jgi:hypothetical protein
LAAKSIDIPSILITNFTFDSVYSYLSTTFIDATHTEGHHLHPNNLATESNVLPDYPISLEELRPLVEQIHAGYCCADLLLRLPGHIPIPSFFVKPELPAPAWVDLISRKFTTDTVHSLVQDPTQLELLPHIELPSRKFKVQRKAKQAPLIVRPPSTPAIYTPEGRSSFLSSIGVPSVYHNAAETKILVVSFGGQMIHKPRSARSTPSGSRAPSPEPSPTKARRLSANAPAKSNGVNGTSLHPLHIDLNMKPHLRPEPKRLTTPEHIWIPGAPPTSKKLGSPSSPSFSPAASRFPPFNMNMIPPTPQPDTHIVQDGYVGNGHLEVGAGMDVVDEPLMLPDESWIAIVCGVSKEQWSEDDEDLPERFFVAPRDVYMPDLTGISDVLLGKLVCSLAAGLMFQCHSKLCRGMGLYPNVWMPARRSSMVRHMFSLASCL